MGHDDGAWNFASGDFIDYLRNASVYSQSRAHQYRSALDAAVKDAGRGDAGWNERFRVALQDHGLCLVQPTPWNPQRPYMAHYPGGWPYEAPYQRAEADGWPDGTLVVWIDWPHEVS